MVQYYSSDGLLVTESLKDYTRKNILGEYDTLDHFLAAWNSEHKKQAIIDELRARGVFLDELRLETGQEQMSDFDLICHIAYDQRPLTRSERANSVKKKGVLYEYAGVAREVLEALLDKYATSNLVDLERHPRPRPRGIPSVWQPNEDRRRIRRQTTVHLGSADARGRALHRIEKGNDSKWHWDLS